MNIEQTSKRASKPAAKASRRSGGADRRQRQEAIMTLMYQVVRQMRQRMDFSDEHDQLNPYHLHALFTLAQQPLTMSQLAEELSISLPSTTALVNRLTWHGWVERQADPTDRRVIRLSLLPTGVAVLKQAKEERYRKLRFLLDAMTDADVAALERIFHNVHTRLCEGGQTKTNKED